MKEILWQSAVICILVLGLGVLNNTIGPNKIAWIGEYKNADEIAEIVINNAEAGTTNWNSDDTLLPDFDLNNVRIYKIDLERVHRIHQSKKAIFIDSRYPADYNQGYIPGAVNLPNDMFDEYYPEVADLFDINEPVVIYCSGPDCDLSLLLAGTLHEMGYTKIMLFEEGFPAWEEAGYPTEGGA